MTSITSGSDTEHLGIPKAVFVEDVDSFMQQPENDSADTVIRRLDDLNSKYRFMEMNLLQKKKRLRGKLPDIQICLDMIEQLRKYKEKDTNMETNFLLAHNLYGKATIPPTDKVCLWLGANVMLEYTVDEAEELLRGNQKTAQTTLEKVDEDLDFLRDQITTTEVNMARLHNWAVKQKQQNKN
jgi:prefoldin subunit 5